MEDCQFHGAGPRPGQERARHGHLRTPCQGEGDDAARTYISLACSFPVSIVGKFVSSQATCPRPIGRRPTGSLPAGAAGAAGGTRPRAGAPASRTALGLATPRSPRRGRATWPPQPVTTATVFKKHFVCFRICQKHLCFLVHFDPPRVGPCLLLVQEAQGEEAVKSCEG